jgi:hypothetical protein
MKTKLLLTSFLITGLLFLFSCSSTNMLTMSVKEPAPVYMPSDVKKIGIVNRSLPSEETKVLDDADKILSLEGKDFDKEGSVAAIKGVYDELTVMNLFTDIKIIEDTTLKSPGMGIFPASLDWETVDKICKENGVDVLYELSFYDTETVVDYQVKKEESVGVLGVSVPVVSHRATVYTKIKTGWRIYDPLNKYKLDEFIMHQQVISEGSGINPMKAIEAIKGRKEGVMEISNIMGHNYATRIRPYYVRVSRLYFVRGSENFKIAKRRARTGDWDGAAELWEKELNNPKSKVAGRACYNMGIINEINGNLEEALKWASKSYTDYKIKKGLDYVNIIKYRINQRTVLENQEN